MMEELAELRVGVDHFLKNTRHMILHTVIEQWTLTLRLCKRKL
jgi:hypothetical protein